MWDDLVSRLTRPDPSSGITIGGEYELRGILGSNNKKSHRRCPGVCFLPLGCTWAQAACLLAVWFFSSTCQRTHAYQRGLQASKRKELRPYLSPSVSLCGYCAWVKLVLLFSKSCILDNDVVEPDSHQWHFNARCGACLVER